MAGKNKNPLVDYSRCRMYLADWEYCNGLLETKDMCAYHYNKSRNYKGGARHISQGLKQKIIKSYKKGNSASAVGREFSVTKTSVLRICNKAGVVRKDQAGQGAKYLTKEGLDSLRSKALKRQKDFRVRNAIDGVVTKSLGRSYKLFRARMLERDKYTCRDCGYVGLELNLEHIKPRSIYPELTYDESNVATLCIPCHKKTDTYAGKMFNYTKVGA